MGTVWSPGCVVFADSAPRAEPSPGGRVATPRTSNQSSFFVSSGSFDASFSSVTCTQSATDEKDASKDRKSTRLNSSHLVISYAVFCLKKKNKDVKTAGESLSEQRYIRPIA